VEEVIAAKSAGETPPEAPRPAASGKVLDLMAALENSVRAARESRGEAGEEDGGGGEAEVTELPRPKRTAPAAAKRTSSAPKKSTARS
ncbi:Ku protein, partial [Streptomyces sp. TRM76130]|nr:Ku protein [Streptomyces sp. TRM76130]